MDRDEQREVSRRFNEMLRDKLESNRSIKLEDLMGHSREPDAGAPPEQESQHES